MNYEPWGGGAGKIEGVGRYYLKLENSLASSDCELLDLF